MTYDKDALAYFHKIDYNNRLKGHTEFSSVNTLRNSIKLAINFDSNFDRFKPELRGGYFSNTQVNPSSFKKKVSFNSK